MTLGIPPALTDGELRALADAWEVLLAAARLRAYRAADGG